MDLKAELNARHREHLYRVRQVLSSPQSVERRLGAETLLSFCSNDYLGLANDPRVIAALHAGAENYGVGAGASHLVNGHSTAHHALEEELADFVRRERSLLFSTGYMANLGVISSLIDRHGRVLEDKLNHASLIDAARLSQATVKRYPHREVHGLARLLGETNKEKLIATDAIFSMDGDFAPLTELTQLARRHDAWLLADDAHGLGVFGSEGRGSFDHLGVAVDDRIILMGTLGKAFGTFGAFVAGSEAMIETLIQRARTYIYTTALPPALAEATRASLKILRQESWRREQLHDRVQQFRRGGQALGLELPEHEAPIQPLILHSSERALAASRHLRQQGILVTAIRPPTVPRNTARLRITFSASHTPAQVDRLLDALAGLPQSL